MAGAVKKLFDHFGSHVTVWTWAWPYVGGVVGVGTVTGLVAKATAWIEPWGPIGWWAAAMVGALIAALLLLLFALAYGRIMDARLKRKIYGSGDKLNPLEDFFDRKRIDINDLAYPFAPIVRKKTFQNCDLVGPCNVLVMGRSELYGCGGTLVQAAIIDRNTRIQNAIAFEDCVIRNCNLYQITFLVPADGFKQFSEGFKDLPWITKLPQLL